MSCRFNRSPVVGMIHPNRTNHRESLVFLAEAPRLLSLTPAPRTKGRILLISSPRFLKNKQTMTFAWSLEIDKINLMIYSTVRFIIRHVHRRVYVETLQQVFLYCIHEIIEKCRIIHVKWYYIFSKIYGRFLFDLSSLSNRMKYLDHFS